MAKERLDVMLVNQGLVQSRERAKTTIMAGKVIVNGQKIDKPGTMIAPDAKITVLGDGIGFVSRGGLKLAKAVEYFNLQLAGKTMADIGASTGGFTDCGLQHGVVKVYAIDVGYGQLAWSLRTDPRVINMERTNIRNVTITDIGEQLDFISIDVAFISLTKVLPVAKELLRSDGEIVALIKPQFEAGREHVGKKGVVKDPQIHQAVINKIVDFACTLVLVPLMLTYSPVKGPEGNIEYLLYLSKEDHGRNRLTPAVIEQVVHEAHEELM